MIAKEKVLKFWPKAVIEDKCGWWDIRTPNLAGSAYLGGGVTPEVAWQNAAESLPAQAEHPRADCEGCNKPDCACNAGFFPLEQEMTDAELDAELRANGIDPHELNKKMLARIREEKAAGKSGPIMDEVERQFEEAVKRRSVESLPVEAKEKEPIGKVWHVCGHTRCGYDDCLDCWPINRANFGPNDVIEPVAEPKPAPSTPADEPHCLNCGGISESVP